MPKKGRPAGEGDGGYTYSGSDTGKFDALPDKCWSCSAVTIDEDDPLGLCDECRERLKDHAPGDE